MNRIVTGIVWSVVSTFLCVSAFASDQIIMRAEPGYARELVSRFNLGLVQQIPGQDIFLVEVPAGVSAEAMMRLLENYDHGDNDGDDDDDDDVRTERNQEVSLPEASQGMRLIGDTDPIAAALHDNTIASFQNESAWSGYLNQPAVALIRARAAQAAYGTGSGVVAVIDTGIDPNHPLLRNWLVPGYDFLRNTSGMPSELDDLDPVTRSILTPGTTANLESFEEVNPWTTAILDQTRGSRLNASHLPTHFGHGTMVAGLVRRIAPTARIMPLKPFGGDGKAAAFNIIRAIYYAQANGAKVINMSLSLPASSLELEQAIRYVTERGVISVASVGNQGLDTMVYPAALQEVVGVASTTLQDVRSTFSNHGGNIVTLAAPGEGLITAYPGGLYAAAWGTSFSAPLVSGTVALMVQVRPGLTWQEAEGALKEAAPVDGNLGNGRLDVFRAVSKATEF